MEDKVVIRPYMNDDYDQVRGLLEESDMYDPLMDTREVFGKKISRDPDSVLVAVLDGKVIGNVIIVNDEWLASIFRLVVDKSYRGRDIGLELLAKAEEYLKGKGYSQVMLFVNDNQERLIDWYKRSGYKHTKNKFKALWKEF